MKKFIFFMTMCFMLTLVSNIFADEKPRVGVLRFTNHTSAGWWSWQVGRELQDMLAAELVSTKAFQVLERKELDAVLGEQDLGESGRIDNKTKAKIGKIKGAQYLVAATVSAYEEETSGSGAGFGIAGFRIGGSKEKAYIAVDLKVIDTETAEIVDARTIEASSAAKGISLGGGVGIFSGSLAKHEKTPTGKAIRACIIEIAEYLECSLVKGKDDECMQEYTEKEEKRKERTKKAIELE
ncbi:MAG: CsgG/HfaB family protein [Nitrospirae bacterium]|nr:CsgG/HfaB family protein [Nitrospirota bacterium]